MKIAAAHNILERRLRHLEKRIAELRASNQPEKAYVYDERESHALKTALNVLYDNMTDAGECTCKERGQCGHCRLKTIPELRMQVLETEEALLRLAPSTQPDLIERALKRVELSQGLAQLRGLPFGLEVREENGRLVFKADDHIYGSAPEDADLRETILWLARNRRQIIDFLGRPAE